MSKTPRYPEVGADGRYVGSLASQYDLSHEQLKKIRQLLGERPCTIGGLAHELGVAHIGPCVENIRRYVQDRLVPIEAELLIDERGRSKGEFQLSAKGKELLTKGL